MRTLAVTILTLLLTSAALAIGPLDEKEQEQVDTAMDGSIRFDEQPALYPLLRDAMTWKPGDESGAAVPDYAAMMQDPQLHRGKLFLIEGTLARRERVTGLFRSGDWEANLEDWIVGYGSEKKGLIVYLTDPPADAKTGDKVRIPARFYMIATRKIENSDETEDFLLFVGHGATAQRGTRQNTSGSGGAAYGVLAGLVIIMVVFFVFVRSRLKSQPLTPRRLGGAMLRERGDDDDEPEDEPGEPLPQNPADALEQLKQRHEE